MNIFIKETVCVNLHLKDGLGLGVEFTAKEGEIMNSERLRQMWS